MRLKNRRLKKVTLQYCVIPSGGSAEIQLYITDRGKRLILITDELPQVLSELRKLHDFLASKGPKLIEDAVDSERKAAIEEATKLMGQCNAE